MSNRKNLNLKWFKIVADQYIERISHTFKVIEDSKVFLKFERKEGRIDNETYTMRLKCVINMAIVYFYSLYEGYTWKVFKKVALIDLGMSEGDFKKEYPEFKDLKRKLIKKKFRIPKYIYESIETVRKGRNKIVHDGGEARAEFEVIKNSYHIFIDYFKYINDKILNKLTRKEVFSLNRLVLN